MSPNPTDLDTRGGGWRPAIVLGVLGISLCGLAYPALGTALGGLLFPAQARGSLIEHDGRIVGSALVAQAFAEPRYVMPRPSAVGFDPAGAGGSNLAPGNPELRERMRADAEAVAGREGIVPGDIPVELISASGSGFDPHLSPAAVAVQVARVARARGIPEDEVRRLVDAHTEGRLLGLFGQPRVNVLQLNLALDAATPD